MPNHVFHDLDTLEEKWIFTIGLCNYFLVVLDKLHGSLVVDDR
jgi:hypothetical protein